jgi:hypothetical protein
MEVLPEGMFVNICTAYVLSYIYVFLYMRCGARKGQGPVLVEDNFSAGISYFLLSPFHPAREGRGALCTTLRRGNEVGLSDSSLPGCGEEREQVQVD